MPRTAYEESLIADKIPLKVESLESWGDQILVGTEQGILLRYDVLPRQTGGYGSSAFQVQMKEPNKSFSKKPILQLQVLREQSDTPLLLSISDGAIQVHLLPSMKLHTTLPKSKGSHLFSVLETPDSVTVAAAFRKKITIYRLEGGHFVEKRELNVGEPARNMVWSGPNLCVGAKSRYIVFDLESNSMREPFTASALRGGLPTICKMPTKLLFAIEKNIGVFTDFNGKPTDKWGITWSDIPQSVEYHYPYVIGILPRCVEIQSIFEGSKSAVQQINNRMKLLSAKGDRIYIATARDIWRLIPVPLVDQIDELVNIKSYDEALRLLEHLPAQVGNESTKSEQMKHIRYLCANHLFEKGQFDDAMKLFQELNCSPLKVLRLFPSMLPRSMEDRNAVKMEVGKDPQALRALVRYLDSARQTALAEPKTLPKQNSLDDYESTEDISEIIDTAMLRACILSNDNGTIFTLLGGDNRCNLKESVKMLTDAERTLDLVRLYKTKGMHQKALDILTNLGKRGNGTTDIINYLKSLGREQLDLILKYSVWPLEETPAKALEIMTEDRSEERKLPPRVILDHIKGLKPEAAKKITVAYLEWLREQGEEDPKFHNELAMEYLNKVVDMKKRAPDSNHPTGPVRAGSESGILGEVRRFLVEFLEQSQHYTPERLLPMFIPHELYEERAILLSRLHEHKEALNTYVHHLKDNRLAEEYCDKFYDDDSPECRDVYLHLLTVYLQPPKDQEPMLDSALCLLSKHFDKINAGKSLNLLPSHIPLHKMYDYFEAVLRYLAEKKRNCQVEAQLLRTENLQVKEDLIHATSVPIKINEDTDCPVCGRSITGSSAFAHYPNGTVVHYGCCKDPHVCPKTGTRFDIVQ